MQKQNGSDEKTVFYIVISDCYNEIRKTDRAEESRNP